ncbi:aldo/keto reductase [Cellulophaga sp. F20128]|uniref:aldo/keto reductase n=1 Tax=Cellulophaga sp. F20128 TaxID=2926413 RepID=UPI001FF156F7|nr:aldo/keto reductase [Cellulophaga sp. F20128]MCK0156110.1 aldo/keto reductase [Cellulophaga sp. F20128]
MEVDLKGIERVTLGTAGLGGAWRPVDLDQSVEAILYALEEGITHLDMAPAYMDAELVVGRALQQWKGEDLFLSTKIGKLRGRADEQNLVDYKINTIKSSLATSLERLNRNTIDLLFLHEPELIPAEAIHGVVDTLLFFKDQGSVKKIGLGGKPSKLLRPFIEQGLFDVIMDFNGYNLVEQKALKEDFPFYRKHHLKIYEGSPLMMGLLGNRLETYAKDPPSWLPLKTIAQAGELKLLAVENNMTLATMAHRYLLFSNNIDRMVIGPAVLQQLEATIRDIKMGPLDNLLLEKIHKIINI